MTVKYAIIGGTGVYEVAEISQAQQMTLHTPYGDAFVTIGQYGDREVAFMARHGTTHATPPHRINYRANIYGLRELGVEQVLATGAVGSLDAACKPGSLVIVDDVIDMTKSRANTFFDYHPVNHIDMSDPYCQRMRSRLAQSAQELGYPARDGGVYVCTEGPRFETKAEIRAYAQMGATVVGMTSMPEAALAKEAQLCYATVCMVTNYAAGLSAQPLTHQEVTEAMQANVNKLRDLFRHFIVNDADSRHCTCKFAVSGQVSLGEGTSS